MNLRNAIVSRMERITGFNRERAVCFPWVSRSGPIYYIVRRSLRWGGNGFFSNVLYALTHIAYARDNGWVPVVDMLNYGTLYSEREPINGSRNDWEHYFVQKHGTSKAYRSGRFILSDAVHRREEYHPILESDDAVELDPHRAAKIRSVMETHLEIVPELEDEFERFRRDCFGEKRILGVHWRGTDKRVPPRGHRPTPSLSDVADAVRAVVESRKPDLIFLASDEAGIREVIGESVDIPVIWADAYRLGQGATSGVHTAKVHHARPRHRYLLGLEVLRDAWLLSRCDYLVHGHSNVTNAAMLMRKGEFEERRLVKTRLNT